MIEQEALVLAIARDNVLISPDVFEALRRTREPVQLTKRIIRDMRADGMDPLVLCREDVVQWTLKDPAGRRVIR